MELLEDVVDVVVLGLLDLPQVVQSVVHALHAAQGVAQFAHLALRAGQLARLLQVPVVHLGQSLQFAHQLVHVLLVLRLVSCECLLLGLTGHCELLRCLLDQCVLLLHFALVESLHFIELCPQ